MPWLGETYNKNTLTKSHNLCHELEKIVRVLLNRVLVMPRSVVVLDEPHLPINHLHIVSHLDPVEVVCVCVVVCTYYVEPSVEVVHVPVSIRVVTAVVPGVEIDSAHGVLNSHLVEVVHSAELHEVVPCQQPVLVRPAPVENGLSVDRVKRQRA